MRYGVPDPTPFLGLRIFCAYFGLPSSTYFPPDVGDILHILLVLFMGKKHKFVAYSVSPRGVFCIGFQVAWYC